jgi:hypothetical protein
MLAGYNESTKEARIYIETDSRIYENAVFLFMASKGASSVRIDMFSHLDWERASHAAYTSVLEWGSAEGGEIRILRSGELIVAENDAEGMMYYVCFGVSRGDLFSSSFSDSGPSVGATSPRGTAVPRSKRRRSGTFPSADDGASPSSSAATAGALCVTDDVALSEDGGEQLTSIAALRTELLETKSALEAAQLEVRTVRKEMIMQELTQESMRRRAAENAALDLKIARERFSSELWEEKRKMQAQREQDFKNFDEDRKSFAEYCREDMAKCELKVKQAEAVTRDHAQSITALVQRHDRMQAEATAAFETQRSFLELEREAVTQLRHALDVSERRVKQLEAAALESAAKEVGGASAAAELISLRAESAAHHGVRLLEIERLEVQLKARELRNEYLTKQLAESESKVERLSTVEASFNHRLRVQATEIEVLRCRLNAAGLGTLWDEAASTTKLLGTPRNVVYRESDGPSQLGSAARYA